MQHHICLVYRKGCWLFTVLWLYFFIFTLFLSALPRRSTWKTYNLLIRTRFHSKSQNLPSAQMYGEVSHEMPLRCELCHCGLTPLQRSDVNSCFECDGLWLTRVCVLCMEIAADLLVLCHCLASECHCLLKSPFCLYVPRICLYVTPSVCLSAGSCCLCGANRGHKKF